MPFDDLDLEFEDEDEAKRKKNNEAVLVDVDLEFQAPEGSRARPANNPRPPSAGGPRPPARPGMGEVKKLDEARSQGPARPGSPVATRPLSSAPSPRPQTLGTSALKQEAYDLESEEVVQLREQMRKVEFDSEVKVAVAEFKTEIMGELLGDMKLLEHQIGQLLVRINAKHPDMKQEALMIKKILADFTAKKRK